MENATACPHSAPNAIKVSSFRFIDRDPTARVPTMTEKPVITLYSTASCAYCVAAKNFLKSRGYGWTEVRVDTDPAQRATMLARTHRSSVPQIFVGDAYVGGYEELVALDRRGGLQPLLEGEQVR
jgi:glutaredoxin 3